MEELNQVQDENVYSDATEEENLFDDAEETTETSDDSVAETPQYSLKVKYNNEEQELNEEQARMYAQKGMNYDRIYEPLERLARANNMQVGEYLNRLSDTQTEYEISKEVDKLKEDPKYEGVSDEILREIANSHVVENVNLQRRRLEESQRAENDAREQMLKRDVDRFFSEYPEFKDKGPESLEPKVYEYVDKGYSLLEAYNKFLRESESFKANKQNEINRKRSLGSTASAGKQESDDFLSGFLNG